MTTHGSKLKLRRLRYHENSVKHVNSFGPITFWSVILFSKSQMIQKLDICIFLCHWNYVNQSLRRLSNGVWRRKSESYENRWIDTHCVCPWFPKYAPVACSTKKYEKPPSPSRLKKKNFWGLWSISRLFSLHFLYNSLLKHTPTIFDSLFLHKSRTSVPASISSSLVLRFGKYRCNFLAIIYTYLNYSL